MTKARYSEDDLFDHHFGDTGPERYYGDDDCPLKTTAEGATNNPDAGVAELVDALGLGPSDPVVEVRVLSPAPSMYDQIVAADNAAMDIIRGDFKWIHDVAVGPHLPAKTCCGHVAGVAATSANNIGNSNLYPK